MQTHPAAPVVNMPPSAPDGGDCNTVLSVEDHIVAIPVVISTSLLWDFFLNVPIATNGTVPPVGTLPGAMVVLVAAALGVKVAVTVRFGVLLDEGLAVGVADIVGEGGTSIEIATSAKPGVGLAVALPLLPPLQLNRIAPKTKNTTGATTSHLSHRNNMKASPMTEASVQCQVAARFRAPEGVRKSRCND